MKVAEYIPRYGFTDKSWSYDIGTGQETAGKGAVEKLSDLEWPTIMLNTWHHDLSSLYTGLNHIFVNEEIIIAILQNLLDAYIQRGGDSLTWLSATFQRFHEHPSVF